MGMGDCPKCWDEICSCGYEYRDFSEEDMLYFLKGLVRYNKYAKKSIKIVANNSPKEVKKIIKQIEDKKEKKTEFWEAISYVIYSLIDDIEKNRKILESVLTVEYQNGKKEEYKISGYSKKEIKEKIKDFEDLLKKTNGKLISKTI
jgi:tRNA G10  N-methylase Trm11